jgi:hypothetical protein
MGIFGYFQRVFQLFVGVEIGVVVSSYVIIGLLRQSAMIGSRTAIHEEQERVKRKY